MNKRRDNEKINRMSQLLEDAVDREEKQSREMATLRNELEDARAKIRALTLELNRKPYTETDP